MYCGEVVAPATPGTYSLRLIPHEVETGEPHVPYSAGVYYMIVRGEVAPPEPEPPPEPEIPDGYVEVMGARIDEMTAEVNVTETTFEVRFVATEHPGVVEGVRLVVYTFDNEWLPELGVELQRVDLNEWVAEATFPPGSYAVRCIVDYDMEKREVAVFKLNVEEEPLPVPEPVQPIPIQPVQPVRVETIEEEMVKGEVQVVSEPPLVTAERVSQAFGLLCMMFGAGVVATVKRW